MTKVKAKPLTRPAKFVRIPITINFALLLALVTLGSSRELYLASTKAGVAAPITLTLQVWFVASTIFATVFFARSLFRKTEPQSEAMRPKTLDWVLILSWWAVLAIVCLFAFMTGMGG